MLTLLLLTRTAAASSGYPAEIESYLGMPCTPQCTICHQDNGGGDGTVVQNFGMAMQDAGLTGGSAYDLLHAALDTLAADGVDSDGDGVVDVDALVSGVDPNTGGSVCATTAPVYGCASVPGSDGGLWPVVSGVVLAAGVLVGRRGSDRAAR